MSGPAIGTLLVRKPISTGASGGSGREPLEASKSASRGAGASRRRVRIAHRLSQQLQLPSTPHAAPQAQAQRALAPAAVVFTSGHASVVLGSGLRRLELGGALRSSMLWPRLASEGQLLLASF